MNRNASQLVQSNRPASRRLHRRPAHAAGVPYAFDASALSCTPATVVGLPQSMVREAGMFELLAAEMRIAELEAELAEARAAACTDPLTGALNRRGLETAFVAEIARADREQRPLCVGVLDIDNFKQLNDRLGHQAGDGALVHLVQVVKDTLRPTDVIARYGGEEFVVLLINTRLDEAVTVMARLQRELTKRFFLHNNDKILITFSAGVTEFGPADNQDSVISRADEAMYQAKKTGKNKVVSI